MDAFDALADPIRRDLLRRLRSGPARVTDLAAEHPVSRPAVSRHLRLLGDAGLVEATEVGRERHYSLATAPLREVQRLLDDLATPRAPVAQQHLDALATEVRRTTSDRRRSRSEPDQHPAPTTLEDSA